MQVQELQLPEVFAKASRITPASAGTRNYISQDAPRGRESSSSCAGATWVAVTVRQTWLPWPGPSVAYWATVANRGRCWVAGESLGRPFQTRSQTGIYFGGNSVWRLLCPPQAFVSVHLQEMPKAFCMAGLGCV